MMVNKNKGVFQHGSSVWHKTCMFLVPLKKMSQESSLFSLRRLKENQALSIQCPAEDSPKLSGGQ